MWFQYFIQEKTLILFSQIAEQIRHVIESDNESALPAVLEIPSKDHPYDPSKDSVLRRAKVCFYVFLLLKIVNM